MAIPAATLRSPIGPSAGLAPRKVPGLKQLLLWPMLAFVVLNVLLIGLDGDRAIANAVYAWQGHRWALQDAYITTTVIHVAGKRAITLLWLLAMIATLVAWRRPTMRPWLRPLVVLVVSVALSALAISVLKHTTHMDCPWDIAGYGGTRPFIGLFTARPAGLKSSSCFPAGHASAGYGWMALYFFLLAVAPRWRRWGLAFGIGVGLLFGLSQQLRGAHFMSHDLWTVMIVWVVVVLVDRVAGNGLLSRRAERLRESASSASVTGADL